MEGEVYSKVANYFYLKDPKLANFTNKSREKPETVTNTRCTNTWKCSRTMRRKLKLTKN